MLENIKLIIFDLGGTLKIEWELYPDAASVTKKLSIDYQLVIGANQPLITTKWLKGTPIFKYFRKVYISEEIGFSKPDTKFFKHILDDQKIAAKRIAVVGDDLEYDIKPAEELGMRTIWIKRGAGLEYAKERELIGKIKPDYEIDSLEELLL